MTGDEIDPKKMMYRDETDAQVATRVRMLYRDQLDHEAVCTGGRDRIMYLSQQLEKKTTEVSKHGEIIAAIRRYTLSAQEMSSGQVMAPLSQILLATEGRIVERPTTEPDSFTVEQCQAAAASARNNEDDLSPWDSDPRLTPSGKESSDD